MGLIDKFFSWLHGIKPDDDKSIEETYEEEVADYIAKKTDYAEGSAKDVAIRFLNERRFIFAPDDLDDLIQPCINRLLQELVDSCTEEEGQICEFANEFTEYIDNEKAKYVKRLRDDSGNVVTSHTSLSVVDVILKHDFMINQYAPLLFRNHFPVPKRVANWKPFLSDRYFLRYKIAVSKKSFRQKDITQFVKDSASDLNPDLGGLMDWQQSVDVLTKKQEEVYRVLDSPEAEPQPTIRSQSEYEPKKAEGKKEEDKISEDTVGDVLSKVQSGGALSPADEQVLLKIEDAKSPSNLAAYRSRFITKTFRPKYEPIITALIDDKNFNKDVPVDWALEQVGCSSWFNEFVIRSILGNCRGGGKYANRFKPRTVLRREVSNKTTDEMGNPVLGMLEKDFPPKSEGGKWTTEPSADNPNWYKVDCLVVMASE